MTHKCSRRSGSSEDYPENVNGSQLFFCGCSSLSWVLQVQQLLVRYWGSGVIQNSVLVSLSSKKRLLYKQVCNINMEIQHHDPEQQESESPLQLRSGRSQCNHYTINAPNRLPFPIGAYTWLLKCPKLPHVSNLPVTSLS